MAIAGLALAFLSASGQLPAPLSVGLALGPLLLGAVAFGWRTRLRWPVVLAAAVTLVIAAQRTGELSRHVPLLWFVEHVGVHGMLAIAFGRTLLPGEEPLVTRVARAVLPSMPPDVVRYSRRVTAAWTIYFVAMTAISVLLYLHFGSALWSAFATLVSGPLTVLMFLAEFAVRRRKLPAHCGSIAQSVQGFRALARSPAARLQARRSHG